MKIFKIADKDSGSKTFNIEIVIDKKTGQLKIKTTGNCEQKTGGQDTNQLLLDILNQHLGVDVSSQGLTEEGAAVRGEKTPASPPIKSEPTKIQPIKSPKSPGKRPNIYMEEDEGGTKRRVDQGFGV